MWRTDFQNSSSCHSLTKLSKPTYVDRPEPGPVGQRQLERLQVRRDDEGDVERHRHGKETDDEGVLAVPHGVLVYSIEQLSSGELRDRESFATASAAFCIRSQNCLRVPPWNISSLVAARRLVVQLLVPGSTAVAEDVLAGRREHLVAAGQAGRDGQAVGRALPPRSALGELGEAQRAPPWTACARRYSLPPCGFLPLAAAKYISPAAA